MHIFRSPLAFLFAVLSVRNSGASATVFPPNDAAITYSPYTWSVTALNASTLNTASSFRTLFSGSFMNVTFDTSEMVTPASQLYWRVDNGPLTATIVQPVVSVAIPVNLTKGDVPYHTLEVFVKSMTETANRWSAGVPSTRVVFTGLVSDGELVMYIPNTVNVLIYGDSITEGVLTLGGTAAFDTYHNDASVVYSRALGPLLGAEMGVVGFGATGLSRGGSGGVPPLGISWNQLWDGVPRVFEPKPDLIVLNEGTNDGSKNITDAMISVLKDLTAACPGTSIAVLLPFNGAERVFLQAAVAATPGATFIDTAGFYNTSYGGGLHPTGPNDVARIAPQIAAKLRPLLARSLAARGY